MRSILMNNYYNISELMDLEAILDNTFYQLNQCRLNPKGSANQLIKLRSHFQGNFFKNKYKTRQGANALQNLIQDLSRRQPASCKLKWSFGLHMAADQQARVLGCNGLYTSQGNSFHRPLPQRVGQYAVIKGRICEVYEFGGKTSQQILQQLLIDDGLVSRKRRNSLLDPKYKYIGIGCSYHKQKHVQICTVIILAEEIISLVAPLPDGKYYRRQNPPVPNQRLEVQIQPIGNNVYSSRTSSNTVRTLNKANSITGNISNAQLKSNSNSISLAQEREQIKIGSKNKYEGSNSIPISQIGKPQSIYNSSQLTVNKYSPAPAPGAHVPPLGKAESGGYIPPHLQYYQQIQKLEQKPQLQYTKTQSKQPPLQQVQQVKKSEQPLQSQGLQSNFSVGSINNNQINVESYNRISDAGTISNKANTVVRSNSNVMVNNKSIANSSNTHSLYSNHNTNIKPNYLPNHLSNSNSSNNYNIHIINSSGNGVRDVSSNKGHVNMVDNRLSEAKSTFTGKQAQKKIDDNSRLSSYTQPNNPHYRNIPINNNTLQKSSGSSKYAISVNKAPLQTIEQANRESGQSSLVYSSKMSSQRNSLFENSILSNHREQPSLNNSHHDLHPSSQLCSNSHNHMDSLNVSNKSGVVENTGNMDVNSRTGSININTKGLTQNSMNVSENHIDGAPSKSIVSNRSSHANLNGVNTDSRQDQASSKVSQSQLKFRQIIHKNTKPSLQEIRQGSVIIYEPNNSNYHPEQYSSRLSSQLNIPYQSHNNLNESTTQQQKQLHQQQYEYYRQTSNNNLHNAHSIVRTYEGLSGNEKMRVQKFQQQENDLDNIINNENGSMNEGDSYRMPISNVNINESDSSSTKQNQNNNNVFYSKNSSHHNNESKQIGTITKASQKSSKCSIM